MNRFTTILLLACCVSFSAVYSSEKATNKPSLGSQGFDESFLIEAKAGYFMPSSSQLANIYQTGWVNYELAATYLFPVDLGGKEHKLGVFSSLNYLHSRGESLNGGYSTRIRILPLTVGLRYMYAFYFQDVEVDLYACLGGRYNWIDIRNHCPYVQRQVNPDGFGGMGELGVVTAFAKYFLINVFMDYSVANVTLDKAKPFVENQRLNISGFTIGGGLGVRF